MFQDLEALILGLSICPVDEHPTMGRCYAAGVRGYMAAYKLAAYKHLQRTPWSGQSPINPKLC